MATALPGAVPQPKFRNQPMKYALWTLFGLAGITVLLFTDYPLFFHDNPDRARLFKEWFILFPHALAGVTATAIGPFQFSTRLRRRNLALHRILGKVYVVAIFIASPLVIFLSLPAPPLIAFAGYVFAALWFSTTLFAFLTARNGHIQTHRIWVIRSYAFTLDFIISRALNPIPAYSNMKPETFGFTLMFFAICYLFVPDVYFSWKEITTRRVL